MKHTIYELIDVIKEFGKWYKGNTYFDEVVGILEKQVPKKIQPSPYAIANECPNCHNIDFIFEGSLGENEYCHKCGQKLDWGFDKP